jgi:hypothetical protein
MRSGAVSVWRAVIARQKDEILLTRERRGKNFPMAAEPALRSPWRRLLSWFDTEPARAVDQLRKNASTCLAVAINGIKRRAKLGEHRPKL